jgi:hypothetical protein
MSCILLSTHLNSTNRIAYCIFTYDINWEKKKILTELIGNREPPINVWIEIYQSQILQQSERESLDTISKEHSLSEPITPKNLICHFFPFHVVFLTVKHTHM